MTEFPLDDISSLPMQENPVYLPLSGQAAGQTLDLLMRKGSTSEPPLSAVEAQEMMAFMRLEHFPPGVGITFQAQSSENGRMMLILAGEANIRMRSSGAVTRTQYSPIDQTSRWFNATEGATLGLMHAFGGLSSRFIAQTTTELFVASMSRAAFNLMKKQKPALALRFFEMLAREMALVALDHERSLQAMNNVARSMQNLIDGESDATRPAPLF